MSSTPNSVSEESPAEPSNIRFLRRLVTVLTVTMILGLITIVAIIVMTFLRGPDTAVLLPSKINLPQGQTAIAFTQGAGWSAVVTRDDAGGERILVLDPATGEVRQTVEIEPK